MKRQYLVLLIFLALKVLVSCENKKSKISQLQSFYIELKEGSFDYTAEDWKLAGIEYNQILSELSACEFTNEEFAQIGDIKGRCSYYFSKNDYENTKNRIMNTLQESMSMVEGLIDEISSE